MPGGGKQLGSGRKSGEAWASNKSRDIRPAARAVVRKLLQDERDPLSVLVNISLDDKLDVGVRIHAAGVALPFIYPRLSASVVANASPGADGVDRSGLLKKLGDMFDRIGRPHLQTIESAVAE